MANLKASIIDIRQAKRRRARNLQKKNAMKKAVKEFVAIASSDKKKAEEMLPSVFKAIDKTAKNHIIHKNTAARKKSQLAKSVK